MNRLSEWIEDQIGKRLDRMMPWSMSLGLLVIYGSYLVTTNTDYIVPSWLTGSVALLIALTGVRVLKSLRYDLSAYVDAVNPEGVKQAIDDIDFRFRHLINSREPITIDFFGLSGARSWPSVRDKFLLARGNETALRPDARNICIRFLLIDPSQDWAAKFDLVGRYAKESLPTLEGVRNFQKEHYAELERKNIHVECKLMRTIPMLHAICIRDTAIYWGHVVPKIFPQGEYLLEDRQFPYYLATRTGPRATVFLRMNAVITGWFDHYWRNRKTSSIVEIPVDLFREDRGE